MVTVAVTGGIACGKSVVGSYLRERGLAVCEADALAHSLMAPGTPVFREVVEAFGNGIVGSDGSIDRRVLGTRIFGCPTEREKLNAIVHPPVIGAWKRWLETRGERAAAVIVPLLYEAGEGEGWDAVICVAASRAVQLARLMRAGLSEADAELRIDSQMGLGKKIERADYVIVNNGSLSALREQTMRVVEGILER